MKQLIDSYINRPGQHCGSTAMRNLLAHYHGLVLDEAVVFGIGAGLDYFMLSPYGSIPMLSGRSASLELDACRHLDIDYKEILEPDDKKAWEAVKQEVVNGHPVMLTGDIYYLDYREFKVHFPAHRFVLVGFDDEKQHAYIMDRIKAEHETCSLEALAKSRNPADSFSTFNLWGRFGGSTASVPADMEQACRAALHTCALRMLGKAENRSLLMQGLKMQFELKTGLAALRDLPATLLSWRETAWSAKAAAFNSDCIEKFGTGGGMFRNLYAGFLQYVLEQYPHLVTEEEVVLCRASASQWSQLAQLLQQIAAHPARKDLWEAAADAATRIAAVEAELFASISNRS
jgi:hypothetical protein